MLDLREEKLVRKYVLAPTVALGAFLSVVVTCGAWVLLVMVDDIRYYASDIFRPGVLVFGLFMVALTVLLVAALLTDRRRPRAPAWLELCGRTWQEGEDAPGPCRDLPPREVARVYQVGVPSAAAVLLGLILLPPAVLLSLYLPHYRAGERRIEEQQQTASAALEGIRQSLEDAGCKDVWSDNPFAYYSEYGYMVCGSLYDDYGAGEASVNLSVTNEGKVDVISYTVGADVNKTNRENLDRAVTELERLNDMVRQAPIDPAASGLLTKDLMPDGFEEAFLSGSLYEEVYEWEDREDGISLSANYYTHPEEEYDEYSSSSFWFRVEYEEPYYED